MQLIKNKITNITKSYNECDAKHMLAKAPDVYEDVTNAKPVASVKAPNQSYRLVRNKENNEVKKMNAVDAKNCVASGAWVYTEEEAAVIEPVVEDKPEVVEEIKGDEIICKACGGTFVDKKIYKYCQACRK